MKLIIQTIIRTVNTNVGTERVLIRMQALDTERVNTYKIGACTMAKSRGTVYFHPQYIGENGHMTFDFAKNYTWMTGPTYHIGVKDWRKLAKNAVATEAALEINLLHLFGPEED